MQIEWPTAASPVHSDTGGDGLAVALLPGVLMNGTLWDHVVASLGDRYRCIVPELTPLGRTVLPPTRHALLSETPNRS